MQVRFNRIIVNNTP
uniref:Uncharacterized protein n=1 Tax=Anguilla anguilla TaxID=7936 RepID=A0A0E9VKL4_ANGAN